MNREQMIEILALSETGMKPAAIARKLNIPDGTVRSYLRRKMKCIETKSCCTVCGSAITQLPHRKTRRFCSIECKTIWWNVHRAEKKGCALRRCSLCGKEFYGYDNRKYCSQKCYHTAR